MSHDLYCSECGKHGNADDLCFVYDECPDEECEGTILFTDDADNFIQPADDRSFKLRLDVPLTLDHIRAIGIALDAYGVDAGWIIQEEVRELEGSD